MPAPAHQVRYSYAEYLALESSSNVKHEFLEGQIYGMAGGSPEHAALAAAVIGLLFGQLATGRCRVHSADLRVRIEATGLSTYPDVTIVCGPREHASDDEHAVINPMVIIEITSPSTEGYDRGDKFGHYKQLESLRQYVLVSHRERCVDVWTRDPDESWTVESHRDGQQVRLEAVQAEFGVGTLYDAVVQPGS